jgi:DNA-nicking Smr family endonuclease
MKPPITNRPKGPLRPSREAGGKTRNPPSATSSLTDDDAALWDHVAKSIRKVPLKPRYDPNAERDPADSRPTASFAASRRSSIAPSATVHHKVVADPPARKAIAPPIADFERRKVRRIASGRIEIDSRLDLHGMTQDEAHGALRAFLAAAQSRGDRTVLVITGKGGSSGGQGREPYAHQGHGRGVLKRQVPMWLAEPDLRRRVVSFTTAAIRHGGEGALYVQLRSTAK